MEQRFASVRRAKWSVLVVFWLAYVTMAFVLLNSTLLDTPVAALSHATAGLVNFTLLANLLMLALTAVILFGWGRLRPSDVGLEWRKLPAGLLAVGLIWLALQGVGLLCSQLFHGSAIWHPQWEAYPTAVVIGWLNGTLFGVAVVEEIGFRGFLIPQFWVRLNGRWRLATAVVLSQLSFAAMHIPQLIHEQLPPAAFASRAGMVFLLGVVFALIYLLSDNLFIAMAFHGLHDSPTLLFNSNPVGQYALIFVLEILFILGCWWWRQRHPRPKSTIPGAMAR